MSPCRRIPESSSPRERPRPLALALYEALTRNAAQLGKLEGRVLVRAEDTGSAVTLDFAGGRVRVSDGEPESREHPRSSATRTRSWR